MCGNTFQFARAVLIPSHHAQCPQTEQEFLFVQRFGESLWAARDAAERYLRGRQKSGYHKACSDYQQLHRKLSQHLDTWKTTNTQLNLGLVSPRLMAMEDSKLIVPGQYDPKQPKKEQHFIKRFEPVVNVLLVSS